MNVARLAVIVPLLAVLAVSGCRMRNGTSVEGDEARSESDRMAIENARLAKENDKLKTDLANARDSLQKSNEDKASLGGQMKKILGGDKIEGVEQTESGSLALNEDFAFAKGSADLNAEGKGAIEKLAARLNQGEYSTAKIIVEGHTDDTPVARASTKEKYGDNWGLSGARAASVIRALQGAGIAPTRLKGQFKGEYAPRVAGGDKAHNRRVEIYLGD